MADLTDLNFDAREVEPRGNFEPIPAGKYPVVIVESTMKPTKAGDGQYLELVLQIQGGPHDGRQLWDRLNLKNPNQTAVDIARQTLSSICRAVNIPTPKDSADLHGKTLMATVKLRTRQDTGEPSNEVKSYTPYEPAVRPAATSNGGAKTADPWNR
jgi:hypothetical protein